MIQLNDQVSIGTVLMAPLAGVTDKTFRGIIAAMGADVTFTEMVSAKALKFENEKTKALLEPAPGEENLAVQLFGHEPEVLAEMAARLDSVEHLRYIDINMGCPAPKLVNHGDGAALMKNPKLAAEIIRQVSRATKKPVTCKFRRGYGQGDETALDFAKAMEDAGASLITVHGRYRDQFYSGQSDRGIIKAIKEEVKIPVIGNGDIFTGQDALDMRRETNCDGIMIARGALGNPWIFQEVNAVLQGESFQGPSHEERINMARQHLEGACQNFGEYRGVREMRKHLGWYFKGLPNSTEFRYRINQAQSLEENRQILEEYQEELLKQSR